MSFQKCPICDGTGETPDCGVCSVCQGRRILHTQTGQPPEAGGYVAPASGQVPESKAEELVKPLSVMDDYSDEEILYYATPYFDELQARKEKQRKGREEDR